MTGVMSARMYDGRKGDQYYTTSAARISCIVVMALAAIMGGRAHHASWRPSCFLAAILK
jgi:hypothetical protein